LLDSIYINNNSAYTNGSIAGYNRSANITLNLAGWGITNPQINKNGATCSAPDCNVLSYNTTTKIIVFNVTSWSNYSVSETPNPFALTACGTLNTTGANYILQNSVNISSGNCFTLTANNIILDLNGYNISGNNNGFEFGILAYGLSNITIKNGLIDKWGDLGRAIYLWDTNESLISNMTITNSYTGLSVRTSSYNIFRDIYFYSDIVAFSHSGSNNILSNIFINESNDDGPSIGYGLYLSSTNDTIINNLTVKYSTNAIYLDHTTSSNNNTITNFTSLSNSYDIFSYGFTPNKNNSLIYNSLFGQIKVYPIAAVISGGLSFPGSLLLANNSIFVNNSISGLSTNTLGSLYNLPTNFNNPKIFKNSLYCLNCLNTTSLNNGNPSFTLEGSGNYSIIDVNSNNITSIVSVNNNNPIRTENLTITASINAATSVWMTIWANNISGTVLLSNNLTNTTANSWNISLATNLSYRVGTYNYTLYANNSLGFFVSQNYTFNSLEQTNISYCRTLDQDNTIYTLIADINSTVNNCLYITRSNVTLNGNGHVLNNINYTASTIIGIYGNGVYNVTIMNFKNITHFAGTTLVGGAGINLINTGTTYSIKNNSFYNCTYGMALTGSNSNIKNNVIVNPNNVTTIYGIYILGSDNVIEDNVIYQPVGQTNGIYLFSGLRSKYVNNNITAFKSFTPAAIGQKVDQIIYNNTYGQVVWYNNTATITNNVTLDNIIISQNNINLNLSLMPLMNKTAEIVFYNHDYHGQYPLRLLNMGKGGVPCNSTFGCNNFTSLTASTVRFNVTDFGNGEIMVGKVLRSQSNVSLSTGWNMISLQMNGSSAGDKVVPLSHGWNLVGVSNDAGVEYANINYTNSSGDSLSMLAASRRGHVQKQFAYLEADGNGIKRYNYAPLETSALTNGKGYWVYVNDADGGNLTLPGAGGNDLGESYSLSDLTFVNASGVEANISEAVSEGWVDPYPSYWNPNHVMLDPITEEEIIRPAWERVGVDRLDQKIYSWEGLFFYSNRNNITLLRQD
jgi:hypothetical protein